MSLAAMGDTTKVDDQERICRELAERREWKIADVYCDNNRSAWQRNRKRPEWDRMLADIDAGRINAIVVYHGDRMIRQPFDLEVLINLAYGKGVKLASPTGDRDLSRSDDLYIVRIEAAGQCRESDRTSERRKSQYERWRREGRVRPGGRGGRAFGFATDGVTHVEPECDVVRDMATRVLRGESAGTIARTVSAAGWRTPAGGEFSHTTVRKMLDRERYAGLMPDGEAKAAWEPVLDRETWELVRLALDAKGERFGYATNARKWLLSGIAACGPCGSPLAIKPSKGREHRDHVNGYACPGCRKVYRSAPLLDAYVGRMVVNRLNHPLAPDAEAPAAPDLAAEWAALSAERAETERVAVNYGASAGRLSLLMGRLDAIDARMAELRERESGSTRARLLETYRGTTWEQWLDEPLEVRRALVSAHFKVTVLPASKRGPGFRTEDVRLDPAG